MENITKEQRLKMLAAAEIVDGGDMAVIKKLIEIQDSVESGIKEIESTLEMTRGVASTIENGKDGLNGRDGIDGRNGVDGRDGTNGRDGRDGKNGLNGKDGTSGLDGLNGQDGSPDNAKQVRDKLESLKEDERLDISAIKGIDQKDSKLSDDIVARAMSIFDHRTSYLINAVSALKTQVANSSSSGGSGHIIQDEGVSLTARAKLNFVGGGVTATDNPGAGSTDVTINAGSFGLLTLNSGSVNGVNQTFTFSGAPNVIVVDQGRIMQKVSSDGNTNWSGTTTVVLQVAPNFDIFAY